MPNRSASFPQCVRRLRMRVLVSAGFAASLFVTAASAAAPATTASAVSVATLAALAAPAASATAPPAASREVKPRRRARAEDSAPLGERYREVASRLIGAALVSPYAYERLHELCDGIGNRLSGSRPLERAVEWAAARMKTDGFDNVRRQPVWVPHWERGAEGAWIVEPRLHPLAMLGLGGSIGTPPGGIEATVVVVRSFAELDSLPADSVRGRIVLYDVPFTNYGITVGYRADGANRAAMRGAVAVLVRSVGPRSLRTPHTGAMHAYVDSIPSIPAAAVSIEDAEMIHRFFSRGERVRIRLEMEARKLDDARSYNVMGELRGRERPDEVVVIGGHLDSWDVGQGAQDDGGGCAISMAALKLIRELGLRPRRTLRCVLWTNEENGARGALAYADSLAAPDERTIAAIESDGGVERLVGFGATVWKPGTETVDSVRTALAVAQLRSLTPLLFGVGATVVGSEGGGTDIGPLMKRGVAGVGHLTTMEHYFDWHHTPADMLDKVDPLELRRNAAALAVVAFVLADMPEPLGGPLPTPR